MNAICELNHDEIALVDGAGSGTPAYEDAKKIGRAVGQAIEDFFEGMFEVWNDGK